MKETFLEIERGFARVLLHQLLSYYHPQDLSLIEEIANNWSEVPPAKLSYKAKTVLEDSYFLASLLKGFMKHPDDLELSDVGPDDLNELVRRTHLSPEIGQKLTLTLEQLKAEQQRLLSSQARPIEDKLVGRNPEWLKILAFAEKAALLEAPVLILGETGTGKDRLARYIHRHGPRHQRQFSVINCGALPESLVVSELFGYENGAFTGAIKGGRRGRLESANGGTVFLDDVDCLPKSAQTSLLRFIETGEIQKMGTSEVHKANARIICASNCDLKALVERGEFRLDLYYRLGIIRIVIPPLRERKDDIHLFAHHFLKQEECMGNFAGKITISEEAVAKLRDYPWEGNLRELQSALLRAAMVCKDRHIQARDLHLSETISIGATPLPPTLLLSPQMTQALERSGFDGREITELIRFLAEHCSGAFSNHHWVERFGVSTTTARNKLKSLEAIGLIRREGTKKGSKYYMIIKDEI